MQWVNLLEFLESASSGEKKVLDSSVLFPLLVENVWARGTGSFVVMQPSPHESVFSPRPTPPRRSCEASYSHCSRLWMTYEENRPGHSARLCVHGYFCFCSSEMTHTRTHVCTHACTHTRVCTHTHTQAPGTVNGALKKEKSVLLLFLPFPSRRKNVKQNI